jgi:plastocyanin
MSILTLFLEGTPPGVLTMFKIRRKMKRSVLLATALLFVLVLTACATSPAATAAQPPATMPPVGAQSGSTVDVSISGYAFNPPTLTIKEGTTVTWTNQDAVVHTVTSDTGVFDSGDLAQGATFSYTFTTAGTYVYHCLPHHARMEGTITVTK